MRLFLTFLLTAFLAGLLPGEARSELRQDTCPLAREMAIKGVAIFDVDPKVSLKAMQDAWELCKTDEAIGYNLGFAYYHLDMKEESRKVWEEVFETFPGSFKTQANLAWVSFELGDDESAHILAFKGLNKYPGNLALAHTKLFSLFRLGRYLEAYDWMTRADLKGVKAKKWHLQAVSYVVETLWRQFRKGEKRDAVARAIMLVKDYPDEPGLIAAKDKMARALVDSKAEVPFPVPLPHEAWKTQEGFAQGFQSMDDLLMALPALNPWEKRVDAFALVVGIYRYRYLDGRPYGDRNGENIKKLLTTRGVFQNDIDHVRLRLNESATRPNLLKDIEWLISRGRLNPNATLLLFFSGHGHPVLNEEGEAVDSLLIPVNARAESLNAENAVSLKWLEEEMGKLENKEVAIILDACFNGGVGCRVREADTDGPVTAKPYLPEGKPLAVAAVAKAAQPFLGGQQGAFTFFLMKGLLGEADGHGGGHADSWIDLEEAFSYAKQKMLDAKLTQDPVFRPQFKLRLSRSGGRR